MVIDLLRDADKRQELARNGESRATQFDWSTVTSQVEDVYRTVHAPGRKVTLS